MKPLVIYHAECTDGFGAAFAAWLSLGKSAEYLPLHHKKHYDTFPPIAGRQVFILDFSFSAPAMDSIFGCAEEVVWLDHHRTSFESWCDRIEYCKGERSFYQMTLCSRHTIVLDNGKSGAVLAWEFFHPDVPVPAMFRHIDDKDRWVLAMPGTLEFYAALESRKPWSFRQWKELHEAFASSKKLAAFIREGVPILRARDVHVTEAAARAQKCHILGARSGLTYRGLAVNASDFQSELGNVLADRSGTFGLVWYVGKDDRVRCSLRGYPKYDVCRIAEEFGGGGHLGAAGFEIDLPTLVSWLV